MSRLDELIQKISNDNIQSFLREKGINTLTQDLSDWMHEKDKAQFSHLTKLGEKAFDNADELLVFSCKYKGELSSRSARKKQYDLAKRLLKYEFKDAAIFIFYDDGGKFRFSFIRTNYMTEKKTYTTWKRYTFFIDPEKPNKTFRTQIKNNKFDSIDSILKAFSIDAVTDTFYNDFKPKFDELALAVQGTDNLKAKQDFALLFTIRIIFIGFVQKRGWLGDDPEFINTVWKTYKGTSYGDNTFYRDWLEPIFFDALNSPYGKVVKYQNNAYPENIQKALKLAPYLNGELFKRKRHYDTENYYINDEQIDGFFDFLFSYNFTIEENTNYDEELELNPEFLGIIFEKLVNKEDGAVYTPRTEVDFMCRMSLVKWLQKVTKADTNDLYYLFFIEEGDEDDQKQGDFSSKQIEELLTALKSVAICDPASGSGAFPVGMMQVLNEIIENLQNRHNTPEHLKGEVAYERKKAIIGHSLYGVEVKQWAVWINQLRLWLSLFVDIPEEREHEFRQSMAPLLPNLDFKIRCGDSLVQRIGDKSFPVRGHAAIQSSNIKRKITELKKAKIEFFYNKSGSYQSIRTQENDIYKFIIDEQIEALKNDLKNLIRPKGVQTDMFNTGVQSTINFDAEAKETIEQKIQKLKHERDAFKEEHPLIWNIEFAEIFYDKGGFDIIIGNPPYVRQEEIADPYQRVKDAKTYKQILQETIRLEYPKYFVKKEKISGKSDLYTYFYIKSLRLLNDKGIQTFICSNSWLDVGYGVWQQKFLLQNCHNVWIIDNHAKRSFANADVNTIISIIDAPVKRKKDIQKNNIYKFIAFKKPFEEVILTNYLLKIEHLKNDIIKTSQFRAYPQSIQALTHEGSDYENEQQKELENGKYIGDKWGGKYLRAPDIFFTILERGKSITSELGNYFKGERYLNTGGADGFFIILNYTESDGKIEILNTKSIEKDNGFCDEIESQYFKPLIKDSPKTDRCILIKSTDALCFFPKEPIGVLAKKYIQWGELNDYDKKSVTKLQTPWYKPTRQMENGALVLIPRSFNDTFVAYFNPERYLSLRYYRLHPITDINIEILIAFINSTLNWLFFETLGNKSLGQGAMDFFMKDFLRTKIPLTVDVRMLEGFIEMKKRKIKNIFIESGIDPKSAIPISEQEPQPLPDRKALDDVVFDAIGLDEEERKEVYRAVCQLVWNRISKAKSV